jgi:hypothetical protein
MILDKALSQTLRLEAAKETAVHNKHYSTLGITFASDREQHNWVTCMLAI